MMPGTFSARRAFCSKFRIWEHAGHCCSPGISALRPPVPPAGADIIVMESTYGDRQHRSYAASARELCAAIADTCARGGNVVIPTFALERVQEILYALR